MTRRAIHIRLVRVPGLGNLTVRRRRSLGLLLLCALILPASALAVRRHHHLRPTAAASRGVPQVGALYPSATASEHTCTASVVDSPYGNTLITAAHCVVGDGAGMIFAPAQDGARLPLGRWVVTAAYLEPRWLAHQDPDADVAFLTVAPRRIDGAMREIEQVTGAYRLASTARVGTHITVIGYPAGRTDGPIICRARVDLRHSVPAFDCGGYVAGTSGSPWVQRTSRGVTVVGVIGGFHQGGCRDYRSYSSPLRDDADTAYARAAHADPGDVAPRPGPDGC